MFLGQPRFLLVAFAVLGGLATPGRAQVSPTPPPAAGAVESPPATTPPTPTNTPTAPATPAINPVPVPAVSGTASPSGEPLPAATTPAPTRPSAPIVPSPGTAPTLAGIAAEAKAAHKVIEIADTATVAGCKTLGQASANSWTTGEVGRARIRVELHTVALGRGASHLAFSGYYNDNQMQREIARFYDCTAPRTDAEPEPEIEVAGADRTAPHGAISAQFELIPSGSLSTNITGMSQSVDIAATYGISGSLDYFVAPFLALGATPGVVLNLKGENGTSTATQLDLRGRLSMGSFASDALAVHGYLTIGASWIYLPDNVTSSGATLGFGLAVNYPLGKSGFLTLDVGYQLGSQSVTVPGSTVEVDVASDLLHLGIGIGSYL